MPSYSQMYPNILLPLKEKLPTEIGSLISEGKAEEAKKLILAYLQDSSPLMRERLEIEIERLNRLGYEYPFSFDEAFKALRKDIWDLREEEFHELIKRGCIDAIILEGSLRIHRRFKANTYWLCSDLKQRKRAKNDERSDAGEVVLKWRAERVLKAAKEKGGGFVLPLKYHVKASLSLRNPAHQYGEVVRVWIPLPRDETTNINVRILDASKKPKHIAPPDHPQRTVYFELEGEEREVWIEYTFVSRGFHVAIDPKEAYIDTESEVYREYTSERSPHIAFTEPLRKLAEEITRGASTPYEKVKRIWEWVTGNVRYAYAKDYLLYDNIPEYVASEKRGDCGMQALLFITLCRLAGIPARWESGWYMNPLSPGMHDWAQFYLEPYGWLYADPSFGNKRKGGEWRNQFYLGSIEGYRLASNIEVYTQFDPPKKHLRSDPVDSQRGEVETTGKNLYYNEWDFSLEILSVEGLEQ